MNCRFITNWLLLMIVFRFQIGNLLLPNFGRYTEATINNRILIVYFPLYPSISRPAPFF
jgi:hypothetical protein